MYGMTTEEAVRCGVFRVKAVAEPLVVIGQGSSMRRITEDDVKFRKRCGRWFILVVAAVLALPFVLGACSSEGRLRKAFNGL